MLKVKNKVIAFTIILSIFLLPYGLNGYAEQVKKTVDAWYNNIKIVVNGTEVQMPFEPFIVDGRTYVSVSALANIFNKDVQWDGTQSKVIINDKADPTITLLNDRIIQKDIEIAQLQAMVNDLETQLANAQTYSADLGDVEDDLEDEYSEYEDIEFTIYLDGDEDDIEVEIYVDLDEYESEWDDLSSSDIKSYLQDIIDDILDAFEDADIEGFIKDSYSKDVLVDFYGDSDGDVVTDISDVDDTDLDDLEEALDDEYYDYFDDIGLSVELEGDEDDITFYVNIAYDTYEDEWDDLSESDIEDLMEDIYEDISDEFEDADVVGYIYDIDNDDYLGQYTDDDGYEEE
ncbi:MAG: stalk domain-containing protein [Bacillota bacterium]